MTCALLYLFNWRILLFYPKKPLGSLKKNKEEEERSEMTLLSDTYIFGNTFNTTFLIEVQDIFTDIASCFGWGCGGTLQRTICTCKKTTSKPRISAIIKHLVIVHTCRSFTWNVEMLKSQTEMVSTLCKSSLLKFEFLKIKEPKMWSSVDLSERQYGKDDQTDRNGGKKPVYKIWPMYMH